MTESSPARTASVLLLRVIQNLVWGVAWGLAMAAVFCLIGVALYVTRGPTFLRGYGISFGAFELGYLGGGAAAGIVLGLNRPLLRWRAGAIATGILGGVLVYGAAVITLSGPIGRWDGGDWFAAITAGVLVGASFGNWAWEQWVEPKLGRLRKPDDPPRPRPPLGLWKPK